MFILSKFIKFFIIDFNRVSFFVIQGINLDVKLVIVVVHKGHLCVRKVSMKYFIGLLLWDDQSSKNTYKL